MNLIFIDVIIGGAACGYFCHKYCIGGGWELVMGGGLASLCMFIGMVLAYMMADDRSRDKRMRVELEHQQRLQQVVMTERINCSKIAVNVAKAMADRVANTIVAKYVDGLSDEDKCRSVLEGVNQIVNSEMKPLSKALFDGLGTEVEKK
jgi:hypothetical protein